MQCGGVTLFSCFCPYILAFSCCLLQQNGCVRVNQLFSGIICDDQCSFPLKKGEKYEKNYTEKLILLSCLSFLKRLVLSPVI